MWVDNANAIEQAMLNQIYDPDVTSAIERFVRPGFTCIDVGANVGAVSLMLAKAVGSTGRVVAIEPGPPYVGRLRDNLALNPGLRDSVRIETVGLGESAGRLTWEADPRYPFNAWIARDKGWAATGGGVEVDIETLDAVVRRLGLSRVDFIKIDVETMELEVLLGARDTLRTRRPVVLFESMEWAKEYRAKVSGIGIFHEIRRLLDSLGYSGVDRSGGQVDWNHLPPNTVAVPLVPERPAA